MITSSGNKRIKELTSLIKKSGAGKKKNAYVIEGIRMFCELNRDEILEVYVSEGFEKENSGLLKEIYPYYEVISDRIFNTISDTKTPQGVMAVVKKREYTLEDILNKKFLSGKPHNLLILDSLQDPGNLGTLIRAGEGAGVSGIIMNETTVDIYNPKVVRSTMGSIFRIPFVYVKDLGKALEDIKSRGINVYAGSLEDSLSYELFDYRGDTAFIIGNEGAGIEEDILKRADKRIKIPMLGKVESLNAGVAGSILMYEAARQRRG